MIRWYNINCSKKCSIKFTASRKKFCLSLHYNGENSYLFVNDADINKFKAKDSEIAATPLYLGNISKDFSVDDMKKKQDYTDMFMILVLIIRLLQLMIY